MREDVCVCGRALMDAVAGKDQWPDFLSPETGGGVSVDKSAPIEQEQ